VLGATIRAARLERRWTLDELAERVGVTRITVAKVERGDLTPRIGTVLEAAALLGVPLLGDGDMRQTEARLRDRLAALPQRARQPRRVDDEF
jgi:transcriptional regulator with XRE-family HTH domain